MFVLYESGSVFRLNLYTDPDPTCLKRVRKLVSASVNLYTILDENMNKKILMRKLFAHNLPNKIEQHTSHFIIIEIQKNNAAW